MALSYLSTSILFFKIYIVCKGPAIANKDKAAIVGDFITDIMAGKSAGIKTIAILGEYPEVNRFPLESVEPHIIVNDITEIPNILLQIFHPSFLTV